MTIGGDQAQTALLLVSQWPRIGTTVYPQQQDIWRQKLVLQDVRTAVFDKFIDSSEWAKKRGKDRDFDVAYDQC
jgi:hypothetical protein